MNKTVISVTRFGVLGLLAVAATACEAEKSRNPLSPNVAGPIAGVSISTPTPVSPVNGNEVLNSQPLRLTFANASSNGERPFWYVIELAADSGFANKLYSNSQVPPASGTQTSVVVDGTLTAERKYYWRVKADDGANSSAFSTAATFDLVVPVVLEAPSPVSPINGQTTSSTSVTLTVNNGGVQGRAGRVEYWFEVAFDQAFAQTLVQQPAERSSGTQTSTQMNVTPGRLFYWRAAGWNGTHTGPWSQVQSFRTPAAPAPPPDPGPPPPPQGPSPTGCNTPGHPSLWTNQQWKDCFFSLVQARGVGGTVTQGALGALRPDLVARGADFQNGWRGDNRPRIFLPVPNCPPATSPNVPPCSYSRTIDIGDWGGPWQWFERGQT
jgi:hypothetical protein